MSTNPIPEPDEKSIVQLQEELAEEILDHVDLTREDLDPEQYDSIRAAIAHYTVTICEK